MVLYECKFKEQYKNREQKTGQKHMKHGHSNKKPQVSTKRVLIVLQQARLLLMVFTNKISP